MKMISDIFIPDTIAPDRLRVATARAFGLPIERVGVREWEAPWRSGVGPPSRSLEYARSGRLRARVAASPSCTNWRRTS